MPRPPRSPQGLVPNSHPQSPRSVCRQSDGSLSMPHEHVNSLHCKTAPEKTSPGSSILGLISATLVYAKIDILVWGSRLQGQLLHQNPSGSPFLLGKKNSFSGSLEPMILGLSLEDCGKTFTHLSINHEENGQH